MLESSKTVPNNFLFHKKKNTKGEAKADEP